MADHEVPAGHIGAYAKTLAGDTIDTVTFADFVATVEVWSDGSAAIYFTTDGSDPVVGGSASQEIPPGAEKVREDVLKSDATETVVKLVSAGTPTYSVSAL